MLQEDLQIILESTTFAKWNGMNWSELGGPNSSYF
jgi:hypothetical protein